MSVPDRHFVLGNPIAPPFPEGFERAVFGMGCFWGAERMFWEAEGVWTTAVGYAGGFTPNPTYEEVCSGQHRAHRGRARRLRPGQDELRGDAAHLLGGARPDPGHAQGNDVGTQYRSGDLLELGGAARGGRGVARACTRSGWAAAATARSPPRSPRPAPFYYAEDYHQQYLAKNPNGYCGLGGTGVSCPVELLASYKAPAIEPQTGPVGHRRDARRLGEARPVRVRGRVRAGDGHPPAELVPFAGRTDFEIAADLLERPGSSRRRPARGVRARARAGDGRAGG